MSPRRHSFLWLLAAAALITGTAWTVLIPPFEGPDESAFYKGLVEYGRGAGREGLPLYAAMMKPVIRLTGRSDQPFRARYNPSFRFVSNRRGRVNMFMHGRAEGMAKEDVRRLYLLRAVTLCAWMVSLGLVFATARLFFGRDDLALLAAVLSLSIPQWSFFSSKIHPEATSALLGAIAYWTFAARIHGRIGRLATWLPALTVLLLAPFADRQAYFLLVLVPCGLVLTETSVRRAAIAAGALLVPAVVLAMLPQFALLRTDIGTTGFGMFSSSYRGGFWNLDNPQYFAFEWAPKMFFGFWGWLGQPSILLPPAIYAALAVLTALSLWGLFLPGSRESLTTDQRRSVWIFAAGVLVTLAPIVYANILIARNSWHGRWLFPSLGPIVIGHVVGWRSFLEFARKRPHAVAIWLLVTAAVLEALWLTPPGEAVRALINGNHYGDRARVMATVAWTIGALAAAGLLIEAGPRLPQGFRRAIGPFPVAGAAWTANLLLLFTFVAPLYASPDAEGFAAAIRGEVAEGEYDRAGQLYRIGTAAYPSSVELRRVADESPLLLMSDEGLLAQLQTRLGRGETLETGAELKALARIVRVNEWFEPSVLRATLSSAARSTGRDPERDEALTLLRVQLDGRAQDPAAGAEVIRVGEGRVMQPVPSVNDEASVDGYTVHPGPTGYSVVTIYFRPLHQWTGRRLRFDVVSAGPTSVLPLTATPPEFGGWKPHELAWESFLVPANQDYDLLFGVSVGSRIGDQVNLGHIQ